MPVGWEPLPAHPAPISYLMVRVVGPPPLLLLLLPVPVLVPAPVPVAVAVGVAVGVAVVSVPVPPDVGRGADGGAGHQVVQAVHLPKGEGEGRQNLNFTNNVVARCGVLLPRKFPKCAGILPLKLICVCR